MRFCHLLAISLLAQASFLGMNTLSERLVEAMAAAGKTQADLVRATGSKSSSVANWINGRTKNLKGKNLVIAAQVLNVSEAWLGAGIGPRERNVVSGWPFPSLDLHELLSLPDDVRKQAESYLLWLVSTHKANNALPASRLDLTATATTAALPQELAKAAQTLQHHLTGEASLEGNKTQLGPPPQRGGRKNGGR